jgi:hypothetical protein
MCVSTNCNAQLHGMVRPRSPSPPLGENRSKEPTLGTVCLELSPLSSPCWASISARTPSTSLVCCGVNFAPIIKEPDDAEMIPLPSRMSALVGEDDFGKPADGEHQRALGPRLTNAERFSPTSVIPRNEPPLRVITKAHAAARPDHRCGAAGSGISSGACLCHLG